MKIVFLTSSYYPFFSAIGKCVYNLVNELKNENEIIVISNMTTINLSNEVYFEGQKIVRIRTSSMMSRDRILAQNTNNKIATLINKTRLYLLRIAGYLRIIISKHTIEKPLVKEYFDALLSVDNVDLIIPTCYPFEAVVAAQEYKDKINRKVQIIPFLFDKFADSPTLHRNQLNKKAKYKYNLLLEEQMIKSSTKVLYVDSWLQKMKEHFSQYDEKLIHVEHPLIIDHFSGIAITNEVANDDYIEITYTGVLDKAVRPVSTTLKIISKIIKKNNKFRFHFYVLGNGIDEVNYYNKEYPDNIINHGQVESNLALSKIKQSDILLSIGNTDTTLIPSKIFEYMSSGKPIIHFYHSDDDRVISMLKDYEIGYCIDQNKEIMDSEISSLIEFCISKKTHKKTFEEVQKIFYKANPNYISNIILNGRGKIDE
ncbi:Glycosyltransferase involved in cell wall bisynthesis [Clostridium amylolyticum]|uniref:Glycosyltransferase involved in cell wall bisynthesis n=1 Tax=Clostridium amylolyticum TaxID=1121298 RepID=A0A1M6M6W2_9CLOT|nr:hypothetical protein [Clostridium amylolyticum]SHJ79140.1 Glycosyltransferase involved in cell wall bisynthesis [Clostridium amylolyticum]